MGGMQRGVGGQGCHANRSGESRRPHVSVQVGHYKLYLEDAHTAFYEDPAPVGLPACAYLHNYNYAPP